ncbi:hypothetical protein O9X99_01920 [Agrobacterium salinitolerans]|uniref:Uncharacterized protein n=1 Tax=Agrobacterium salinitolerans TaxID=1183413 RepID=A0ABY3BVM1_9HYPH|nr:MULTISPECIES: hypothetical protein [Agrobacterium]MCZ7890424.1 hypothetical protein [Agrobacterium salinitolerans]TRA96854.1 hypothetical protein EXN23_01035 [Agrobacterium salinitolerans]
MTNKLLLNKLLNGIAGEGRDRAKRDLITRPRLRTSTIRIATHDREQELVIGGKAADVSYTIVKTTLDYEPPAE